MRNIDDIKRKRKESHDFLIEKNSAVYKAFLETEKETYKNGKLGRKEKELIAVGISVVINCESCMQWHVEQALINGADETEVIEAVEVAVEMGGGPATAYARFALEVLRNFQNKNKEIIT